MSLVVKRDIDWVIDDVTGVIIGYQRKDGFTPFSEIPVIGINTPRVLRDYTQDNTGTIFVTNVDTPATVSSEITSPWGGPGTKFTIPDGNTNCEIGLTGLGLANFDGHFAFEFYVEDYTKLSQISLLMGTTGYAKFLQNTHSVNNSDTGRFSGFHTAICGPASTTLVSNTLNIGTDTIDAIKCRIFRVSGQTVVLWLRRIMVVPKGRPTFVITHDDCSSSWISHASPLLRSYNLKADFSIETNQLDSGPLFLTTANLLQLANEGHRISSHNQANTPYGTQTAAEYGTAYKAASAVLGNLLGSSFTGIYHPWVQGLTAQDVIKVLRGAGVLIARGVQVGFNYPQVGVGGHIMQMRTQAMHTLSGLSTSEAVAKANIDAMIATVMKYGLTATLMVHEITTNAIAVGTETRRFAYEYLLYRVAQECQSGYASCVTMDELYKQFNRAGAIPAAVF